jgi:(p)ppGpp synthase/HD superfamily hydrolase
LDLVGRAREFALRAYGSEDALAHPAEVARLVEAAGFRDHVVAAALLHDVIEDTDVEVDRIAAQFGSQIAALVATLTEDGSIRIYSERKADLRTRACAAGSEATAIFVADKLSRVRRIRREHKRPKERKLAHYEATLEMASATHPGLPLLDQLRRELAALRIELQRVPEIA